MEVPPPRWLGGEFSIVKPVRRLCGAAEKIFVRGIVLTLRELRRATIVERAIECPHLVEVLTALE